MLLKKQILLPILKNSNESSVPYLSTGFFFYLSTCICQIFFEYVKMSPNNGENFPDAPLYCMLLASYIVLQ